MKEENKEKDSVELDRERHVKFVEEMWRQKEADKKKALEDKKKKK